MPALALIVALTGPGEPAPGAWWQITLATLVIVAVPAVLVLRRTRASVEVDGRGLRLRDALVVPAAEIGRVERVPWHLASYVSLLKALHGQRVPAAQNLYGGGYGVGTGVAVEHRPPGGTSSWWLLPGPRQDELIVALEEVRDGAAGRGGRA